ncbi:MAG: MlaD family protein [bacterium]|nr:MlaD family protein [bacterium]
MRRHLFWIFEVFFWLLVLVAISGVFMFCEYQYKKRVNSYQVFLPDVDGLIKGSPVRMLGINIGYISQIHIVNDEVYVKFLVTKPNVKLPKGSVVTVEFSGLGGSKSLEVYEPNYLSKSDSHYIVVQSPKRISQSFGLLDEMFKEFGEITYTISNFMSKLGFIHSNSKTNFTETSIENILDLSNKWLDKKCSKINLTKEKYSNIIEKENSENDKKNYETNGLIFK